MPYHPLPWSEDGTGEFLVTPAETTELLEAAGFVAVDVTDTGGGYLEAYRAMIALADRGELPPLGLHVVLGPARQRSCATPPATSRRGGPIQCG